MRGTMIVACNCDFGCPCNVNGRPSTGKCEGGWTWHVDSGNYGDAALAGPSVRACAHGRGAIQEGGGVAVAFIDEGGDEAQRDALATLVRGEAGGPWAIFISTYELAEPRAMPYDVEVAEGSSRF